MKKPKKYILTLLIVVLHTAALLTGGCTPPHQVNPDSLIKPEKRADISQYTITAQLNTDDKTLTATEQIQYINNEKVALSELYFHIYTNAFKKQETAPFLESDMDGAYPDGFSPGYTDIKSVSIINNAEKTPSTYSIQGDGESILKVLLPQKLKPTEKVTLEMQYTVKIPPAQERFGYAGGSFNLGNWYPIAAVYDQSGWNLDKYYPIGDPFYSDIANYTVTIKAPKEYTVAASGLLADTKTEGDGKSWRFEADAMRDFAFVANNKFKKVQKVVEGTLVQSYYYRGDDSKGKKALDLAEKALIVFNEKFGQYPYPTYSVVETQFPSGMEYPGIVYISELYYKKATPEDYLLYTIVHETAHQWWYGIVGNDQIDEAWLDEGFAAYSETIYNQRFSKSVASDYYENTKENAQSAIRSNTFGGVVLKPLGQFRNWDDYAPAVYDVGAVILDELRKKVGDEVFFNIMKTYYKEYKFKIASTEDFIRVSEQISGMSLRSFFDKWLRGQT